MSARANGLAVVASALLAQACARAQPDGEAQPTPSATLAVATAPAPATPVDHLAPGELVEGPREAFGIALPRDLQVTASFVDAVSAKGPVSVHSLVQYLGARLAGGSLREGTEAASFEHVTARGKPDLELRVRITSELGGSRLEIHKVPHLAAPVLPNEESRWRRVGLTPQGKILDPSHLD